MNVSIKSEPYSSDISMNNPPSILKPVSNENSDELNGKKKRIIPFWSENPNILLDQRYIFEFFPIETMYYNQKLNAVSRIVILLTILGFMVSKNLHLLIIGLVTLGAIYIVHYYHVIEKDKVNSKKEGFAVQLSGQASDALDGTPILREERMFDTPDSTNPLSNVLLTDYDFNPNKRPAPPSFNKNINDQILVQAKQFVVDSNPDQPDIADKLFKDLGENLVFEQSMRQFNSNPGTTIPNDQGAFAEFCYGSMISCKEGNNFACARNKGNHNFY